jgi:hypothetical protein
MGLIPKKQGEITMANPAIVRIEVKPSEDGTLLFTRKVKGKLVVLASVVPAPIKSNPSRVKVTFPAVARPTYVRTADAVSDVVAGQHDLMGKYMIDLPSTDAPADMPTALVKKVSEEAAEKTAAKTAAPVVKTKAASEKPTGRGATAKKASGSPASKPKSSSPAAKPEAPASPSKKGKKGKKKVAKPSTVTPGAAIRRDIGVAYFDGDEAVRADLRKQWSRGIIRRCLHELAWKADTKKDAKALVAVRSTV